MAGFEDKIYLILMWRRNNQTSACFGFGIFDTALEVNNGNIYLKEAMVKKIANIGIDDDLTFVCYMNTSQPITLKQSGLIVYSNENDFTALFETLDLATKFYNEMARIFIKGAENV